MSPTTTFTLQIEWFCLFSVIVRTTLKRRCKISDYVAYHLLVMSFLKKTEFPSAHFVWKCLSNSWNLRKTVALNVNESDDVHILSNWRCTFLLGGYYSCLFVPFEWVILHRLYGILLGWTWSEIVVK